jgi:divalent metal cation (Fe/Co/Zn/Cd) transporter
LGGSLTIKAEAIRFVLGMSIEIFAYTLAGSAGDYQQRLDRVRSRRSGRVVFVEIVLSFEPGLTIAEVNCRIAALKHSMANEIEHADISILTTGAETA